MSSKPKEWWRISTAFPDHPTLLEDALRQFELACAKVNHLFRDAENHHVHITIQPTGRELFHLPPPTIARIAAVMRDCTRIRFLIVTSSPHDWRAAIHAAREAEPSEHRKRDLTWWLNGGKPMNIQIVLATESTSIASGLLEDLLATPANEHRVRVAGQASQPASNFIGRKEDA